MNKEEPNIFSAEEFQQNFKKNKKSSKREEKVQVAVCDYLRMKYPNVIFMCDLASGLKLPIWLGALHKQMRSSRGLPDLFIAKPMMDKYIDKVGYNGLFLEIKKDGTRRKDGTIPPQKVQIKKNGIVVGEYDHHAEQEAILQRLRNLGYKAEFAVGFDEAIKLIDEYLC